MRTASAGDLRLRGGVDDLESGAGGPSALPGGRKPSTAGRGFAPPPAVAALTRALASADPKVVMGGAATAALLLLWLASRAGAPAVFALLAVAAALTYAVHLATWVLARDEGTPDMAAVSEAIREGAEGFFQTQYTTIARLAGVCAGGIYIVYAFRRETKEQEAAGLSRATLAFLTSVSFLLGAACSAAAGYVGMWVSVRANVRVAGAARRSPREALAVALRAGGFSALLVVGMVVFGVTTLYALLTAIYGGPGGLHAADVPLLLVGYGFGASFVALFAQLGGGIYTKAADVGADLVGKIEAGIPEDDPRNPAVVADLVGDNVGDCAARGADLFESIAAEIIAAMILGGSLAKKAGLTPAVTSRFIAFPLVVHACDLLVTAAGIASVDPAASAARPGEDPYDVLKGGYKVSLGLAVVAFVASCRALLHVPSAPAAWIHFAGAGLVGVATAIAFVAIAQYYTDYKFKPVRELAAACATGHATNVIAGVALGLESTAAPVAVMSVSLVSAYWLGNSSGLTPTSSADGLFGTAVATMGMLSTAAYVLTMDVFGPIADNAGGIVEMSDQPESVRDVTDALDAVGNTTKATTKGYAIGSAGLASFLLFSAFNDEVAAFTSQPFKVIDIAVPEVFVAGLLGAAVVFLFSAWACAAVGRSAGAVVAEVRRQLSERPGIMTYAEKPDYARCVAIVAASALREMVKPGVLAVVSPVAVGVLFRLAGAATGQPLLGAQAVAAFLMLTTVTGILMALFFNTSGGAWDNAKKYVETGAHGGKGSASHAAAVTGDTVGDPFKDTTGPSLHVLIKLTSTIALVACPLFI